VKSVTIDYDGRRWQFAVGFAEMHGKLHGLPKKVLIFPMFIAFRHTPAVSTAGKGNKQNKNPNGALQSWVVTMRFNLSIFTATFGWFSCS